jgi:hypothetical protein
MSKTNQIIFLSINFDLFIYEVKKYNFFYDILLRSVFYNKRKVNATSI